MHIAPYDNQNKPIVDVDDACVPLNYFNIVKLEGESFDYQVPGYETCIVPATGTVDRVSRACPSPELGNRGVDVWDGEPEGVYVPTGAKARSPACPMKPKPSSPAPNSTRCWSRSPCAPTISIWCSTAPTTPRPTARSSISSARSIKDRVGRLLVSELFTVGQGGWSGFPSHKHDTDRLPDETRHDETYNFRFRPNYGSGVQMLQRVDNKPGDAYHIVDGSTICLDKGYHPARCCRAMRCTTSPSSAASRSAR
jgi:5-deoxy-glucuronate isomerase